MLQHPFIESRKRSIFIAISGAVAILLQSILLYLYSDMPYSFALFYSFFSVGVLALLGYAFWFVIDVIRIVQANVILSVVALVVWLACCFAFEALAYPGESLSPRVLHTLPLQLFTGLVYWIVLLQWYRIVKLHRWREERIVAEAVQAPMPETIDRIAVKNGTRIHIIQIKELSHVQACGDYIMLFTSQGEYLKEQTMKSLEAHLPSNFVRIHRSYIVNIEQIERVELFGKETYHVHLKNGVTLKASISGYKVLKEALAM